MFVSLGVKRLMFLAGLIVLSSCSNTQQNQFTVEGVAKNAEGKTIKLLSFGEQQNTPVLLDSCVIDKKGNYQLSTISNLQELYLVKVDEERAYWLISDSKKINLNFDYKVARSNKVSNSANSEILETFIPHFDSLYTKWKAKKIIQDAVLQKRVSDSLAVVVKGETSLALQKVQTLVNKTISNNQSVALKTFCIFYSYKLNIIDIASVYNYSQALYKEYNNHPQVVFLYNQVLEATKGNAEFLLSGKPAPNINSIGINTDTINLKNYIGNYIVLDFWESSNSIYRQQTPALVELYKAYKDTNLIMIGIGLDSNKLAWQKAIRVDSLKWKHVQDSLGLKGNFAKQYLVKNLPARYLINTEGNIVAINLTVQQLREKLREIYKR
jgi:peroxiredoxin